MCYQLLDFLILDWSESLSGLLVSWFIVRQPFRARLRPHMNGILVGVPGWLNQLSVWLFFLFIYLFWEREKEREWERRRRERERIPSMLYTVYRSWWGARSHKSWDDDLSQNQVRCSTKWTTQVPQGSNSWFQFRSWSQCHGIELHAECGFSLSLSVPPWITSALSQEGRKDKEYKSELMV